MNLDQLEEFLETKLQAIAPQSGNPAGQNQAALQTPRVKKISIRVTEAEAISLTNQADGKKLSEHIREILFESRKRQTHPLTQVNRDAYLLLLEINERLMEIQESVTVDESGNISETNQQISALLGWIKQAQMQLVGPVLSQAAKEQAIAPTSERNSELEEHLEVRWE